MAADQGDILKPTTVENMRRRHASREERLPILVEEIKGMTQDQIAIRILSLERTNDRWERNYERLSKWAQIDHKTMLPEDELFKDITEKEMGRVAENPKERGVRMAIIDLDDFGLIDKKYGELIGDKVLGEVGKVLLEEVGREGSDTPCRWGGEEFAMLMPYKIDPERPKSNQTRHHGDHIRLGIANMESSQVPQRVTASVGVTSYDPGETFDSFFDRADWAMRIAKLLGKNRTVEAAQDPEHEEIYTDLSTGMKYIKKKTDDHYLLHNLTKGTTFEIQTNEIGRLYLVAQDQTENG